MSRFKKTGDLYVGKWGDNGNAGTDRSLPKLTIQGALDVAGSGDLIIIGDGIYNEVELTLNNVLIEGDSENVIIEGNNVIGEACFNGFGASTLESVKSIIIIGFDVIFTNVGGGNKQLNNGFENLKIFGGSFLDAQGGNGAVVSGLRLVNVNHTIDDYDGTYDYFNNCIYEGNYTFTLTNRNPPTPTVNRAFNLHFGENGVINLTEPEQLDFCEFSNINCPINYNGTTYQNLEDFKAAFPSSFPNCINTNALFNRVSSEIQTLDFSVQGNSLLLLAGKTGTNIGGVRRGVPSARNSDSVQNGTITNIVFDGNIWRVQSGNTTGFIESDVIDFGLTIKSPILRPKGLFNYLDSVPDFDNTLLDPNKLDLQVRYSIVGEDISLKSYKTFLLNERVLLDTSDRSTGEADFDWDNTVTQSIRQIQYKITLRENYNAG